MVQISNFCKKKLSFSILLTFFYSKKIKCSQMRIYLGNLHAIGSHSQMSCFIQIVHNIFKKSRSLPNHVISFFSEFHFYYRKLSFGSCVDAENLTTVQDNISYENGVKSVLRVSHYMSTSKHVISIPFYLTRSQIFFAMYPLTFSPLSSFLVQGKSLFPTLILMSDLTFSSTYSYVPCNIIYLHTQSKQSDYQATNIDKNVVITNWCFHIAALFTPDAKCFVRNIRKKIGVKPHPR